MAKARRKTRKPYTDADVEAFVLRLQNLDMGGRVWLRAVTYYSTNMITVKINVVGGADHERARIAGAITQMMCALDDLMNATLGKTPGE
jgi:hypothetical protein